MTLAGIFVLSILIGIISSGIESRLEELRKGRTLVVEQGHTLILGWSPKLHQILTELEVANANQRNPCVVVLADRDKVAMEDEVRARAGDGRRTRVICRSGSTSDAADLDLVRPEHAKSILVLLDEASGDPGVVKTDCIILDFGTSSLIHGSLEQDVNLKGCDSTEDSTQTCHSCSAVIPLSCTECPICGEMLLVDGGAFARAL